MSGEEAALTFLLQMLKEITIEYKDIKSKAGLELEKLNHELHQLQSFLKGSSKSSEKDDFFRDIEKEIRHVVYVVEDAIAICLTKKAQAKTKGFFRRNLEKLSITMAREVKSLREENVQPIFDKIKEIRKGTVQEKKEVRQSSVSTYGSPFQTFIQGESSAGQSSTHSNEPAPIEDQSNKQDKFVDLEERATIIEYLKESGDQLDVISLSGMAGIGKTTLAQRVLEDASVVQEFPLRILIRVPQVFSSEDIFLEMLEKLLLKSYSNLCEDEMINIILTCLKKEKFLLVIDGLWAVEDWEVIQKILPKENMNGKVLITSRHKDVALSAVNVERKHLKLKELELGKRWELLKLNIFGNPKYCPEELETIGRAIVGKCGGSPIVLSVIGGILKEPTINKGQLHIKEKWLEVLDNVGSHLIPDNNKSILNAVELSYNRLSYELKVCFLYTGFFPDNHEILTSTLTQLWIAEGFVPQRDNTSLKATAHNYLDELITKNLLLVEKESIDGVKSCRVHDTIREYCRAKAVDENLFTLVKDSERNEPSADEVENLRRLFLHSDLPQFYQKAKRVRSYISFFILEEEHISTIPDAFSLLRVLNCKSVKFEKVHDVKRLILLKHITLSIDKFDILPEEISQLVNLQTLIIETKSSSITVKANIWKMMQLELIKTRAEIFLDDRKWKGGVRENLHTVSRLSPKSCTAALSSRAGYLKTLGIRGQLDNLFSNFSLENFHRLENLKLVNDYIFKSPLARLPHGDRFPPELKKLTLSNTCLKWSTHMPILATISTLEVLKLKEDAFRGTLWDAMSCVFHNLRFLLIGNLDLTIWYASATQFPKLTWLFLNKCANLEEIPSSLEKAQYLEKLQIECLKQSAVDSAKRIERCKKQAAEAREIQFGVPFKLIVDQVRK